jgi:hypothetical protein
VSVRRKHPEKTHKPPKGTEPPRTVFVVKTTEGDTLPGITVSKVGPVVRRVPVPGGGTKRKKIYVWGNKRTAPKARRATAVIDLSHPQGHLGALKDGECTRWWAANVRKVEDGLLDVPKGWSPHPEKMPLTPRSAPVSRTVWYVVTKTHHGYRRRGYLAIAPARKAYGAAKRHGQAPAGYTLTMGPWTHADTRSPDTQRSPEMIQRVRALTALHAHQCLTSAELRRAAGLSSRMWEDMTTWLKEEGGVYVSRVGWFRSLEVAEAYAAQDLLARVEARRKRPLADHEIPEDDMCYFCDGTGRQAP